MTAGLEPPLHPFTIGRRLVGEALGTGLLLAVVVGSGTASTSFANPAVTVARSLSNAFAGITPGSVPWFLVAQSAGAFASASLFSWLLKERG